MKHIITKIRLKIFNYKRRFQTILGMLNFGISLLVRIQNLEDIVISEPILILELK